MSDVQLRRVSIYLHDGLRDGGHKNPRKRDIVFKYGNFYSKTL